MAETNAMRDPPAIKPIHATFTEKKREQVPRWILRACRKPRISAMLGA